MTAVVGATPLPLKSSDQVTGVSKQLTMVLCKLLVLCCVTVLVQCACKYNERHLYYKELGCKPVFTSDAECPSSYDCSNLLQREYNKCYYKGQSYSQGAILQDSVFTDSPCTVECRCLENYDNSTEFNCVTAECPDLFGPPLKEGCVRQYSSIKQCCSTGTYCSNEKSTITKCTYKGKEYVEGEKIYPEDEPCKECICGAGFNETLSEPWCRTISCKYELFYADRIAEGCVPLLYKELSCCPIDWKCPNEGKFSVLESPDTKTADSSIQKEQCQFGPLKLNIGDKLASEDDDDICRCDIPPQVSCFKKQ